MKLHVLSTAAARTCCFVLIVIFSSVGKSTAQTITNDDLDTNATTTDTGSRRNYTPQQCTSWINSALTADTTNSSSLSQSEYLTFLQSITTPAHVGPYFESFGSFGELPYGARIANVILSCACTTLPGYNETCCSSSSTEEDGGAEGEGAEVPLDGFSSTTTTNNNNNENNESLLAYRSYFCDILANVVSKVPMPPTLSPSRSSAPTLSGVPSSFTSSPTSSSTSTATAIIPTQVPSKNNIIPPNNNTKEPGIKGTLSPGAITGIILAILVLILVAILILIWYRRKREEEQVREEFAGENNNVYEEVGDDGGGVDGVDEEEQQQQQPEEEDEEKDNQEEEEEGGGGLGKDDDASSVPSVWSESDKKDTGGSSSSMKTDAIADGNDNDAEQKEGSAVAAMGVASTVVRQLSTPNKNDEYYQLNV